MTGPAQAHPQALADLGRTIRPVAPISGGDLASSPPAARRNCRRPALLPAVAALLLALAACSGDDGARRGAFPEYRLPSRPVAAPEPIPQREGRGTLILHGGGYLGRAALDRIVAQAGTSPTLCVIDTASKGGGESRRFFRGYDGLRVRALAVDAANADARATIEALRACSGYYFGGGNPQRLSRAFRPDGRDSPALAVIRERFARHGAVVSGSSAGAMIVGPITLCECGQRSSIAALLEGTLFEAPGFALVEGVMIDAHFFARGLLGRHLYALARNGVPVGVGVDEANAVVVPGDGGPWEVVGDRAVAVIEALPTAAPDALHGFTLSLLSPGDRFDPLRGTFAVASERRPMKVERAGIGQDGATEPIVASNAFAPGRIAELLIRLVKSPAAEAVGYAAHRSIRVTIRETEETQAYFDGVRYSILRLSVDIDRGGP